jgi:hypothetical protein
LAIVFLFDPFWLAIVFLFDPFWLAITLSVIGYIVF